MVTLNIMTTSISSIADTDTLFFEGDAGAISAA